MERHIDERTKRREISDICTRCLRTAIPEIHAELGLPADFDVDNDSMPPPEQRKCRRLRAAAPMPTARK